jgi:prophage antirepressor-like protein
MNFFLDIFNKLLKINKNEIIIIFDVSGDVWFSMRDIFKALGYNNVDKAINKTKINNMYIQNYKKLRICPQGQTLKNMQPQQQFINEHGLYQILANSTKPLAKLFMDKYINEIMPQIRKTGQFILDTSNKQKLDNMNHELEKVKKDNMDLLNNQRNVIYPKGKAIYVIINHKNNKKYYKFGYTKNLNYRLNTYNTSFPYKILFNYYVLVHDKQIDECIKKIMKNDEFIKNKEYYMTSLNKILEFITKCDVRLNTICCGYCLKCYNFDKIKIHKCKFIK